MTLQLFLTGVALAWEPFSASCSSQERTPGSVGSSPRPVLFLRRPHAHSSQLALPSASTPALLIHLLSLLRPPYKPNNSTFGIVQQASEFSEHPHSSWGELAVSRISFCDWQWVWGVVATSPLCTLACTHQQEKTEGLAQSLSAHGRRFKPSCRGKKTMLCM